MFAPIKTVYSFLFQFTTKMSIIYEVNLQISTTKATEYLSWLQHFIDEMLKIAGFMSAEVFSVDSTKEGHVDISVQYELENQHALDEYMKNHQSTVSKQGTEFGVQLLSRRVLRPQFKHFRQTKNFGYVF